MMRYVNARQRSRGVWLLAAGLVALLWATPASADVVLTTGSVYASSTATALPFSFTYSFGFTGAGSIYAETGATAAVYNGIGYNSATNSSFASIGLTSPAADGSQQLSLVVSTSGSTLNSATSEGIASVSGTFVLNGLYNVSLSANGGTSNSASSTPGTTAFGFAADSVQFSIQSVTSNSANTYADAPYGPFISSNSFNTPGGLTLAPGTYNFNALATSYANSGFSAIATGSASTVDPGTITITLTLTPAPEPTSLFLWLAVGMVGVWHGSRTFQRRLAASTAKPSS